ncbi:type 1 glutamine amidotransferase domain-containing protein [Planococcus lenghuensis]|uniref:Thiamine biosynthesis protein ThiJ n=1 Tax=Planococcus lenghuensis TaxID=2213202 RepID=A0A1Q2L3Y0_9BACL|nr:type 1 glutamine amidotransferase domain-containing protein [Planococcus lenghuensis]AQQ55168.1 thiamine biosynthesis protein ThiJ [Planococcus lenghuensis]
MAKILAVLSSGYANAEHDYVTGWWAKELFMPMVYLEDAGHVVDIASPDGNKPVIDPKSLEDQNDPKGIYNDMYNSGRADKTQRILNVPAREYDALYIVGGHGAMFDLVRDENLRTIVNIIYENGGTIGAIGHGVAPLLFTKTFEGKGILDGLEVTGYPEDREPEEVKPLLPFSLEQELSKRSRYHNDPNKDAVAIWGNGQILTARDAASAKLFSIELVEKIPGLAD